MKTRLYILCMVSLTAAVFFLSIGQAGARSFVDPIRTGLSATAARPASREAYFAVKERQAELSGGAELHSPRHFRWVVRNAAKARSYASMKDAQMESIMNGE